jgi:spore maturation protein A
MNKIWLFLVLFALVYGIIRGNAETMVMAIFDVPNQSIMMLIKIGGFLILYNGILEIAINSGLISKISRIFKKPIRKIFYNLDPESPAQEYIAISLIANLLGMGAAGTPSTIKALQIMRKENENKSVATPEMMKFLLLNITSFTILPLSILSIRKLYEAKINFVLIPYFILGSLILSIFAILVYSFTRKNNGK